MTAATKVIPVVHDEDPKTIIHKALKGHIEKIKPTAGDIILCVYERPQKMKSGLYMPDTAGRVAEDKWQGCVGLIVAAGPDVGRHRKALGLDVMPGIGDWVLIRRGDGIGFVCNDRMLVQLQADFIRDVLTDPDVVI